MFRYFIYLIIVGLTTSNIVFAANIDSLINAANTDYTNGKYDDAIKAYETVLSQGYESDILYFNIGNAYFKQKNIPAAILNYERAARLNPTDEDINFNLELAKTFTVDKIEPLPEFILKSIINSVRKMFSSNGWAILSMVFLVFSLASGLFFWFSFHPLVKKITFAVGVISIFIMLTALIFSSQQKKLITERNYGIVYQSVISVKSSPGESGKDLFILHAGTKVKITNILGDWLEIRIADGNKGWVLSETIQKI